MNVNEPPSPQDRTRGFTEDRIRAAIGLLIAGGLIFLIVGMVYLDALAGSAELLSLQVVGL
jgi:hypothetical protein